MAEKLMTFTQHLEELRHRLKYAVWAVLAGVIISYVFSELLFVVLTRPLIQAWIDSGLGSPKLHFANPIEPFFTYLKVALLGGVFIASPLVFYQLWMFVAPGLYKKEKRYVIPFTVASAVCFVGGAAFGYFMVFPYGFKFFLSFAQSNVGSMQKLLGDAVNLSVAQTFEIKPTLMMGEVFGLIWRLLLAFGVVFELPLVIFFLALVGVVSPRSLWRFNRYFIILSFVAGAMLTPPDVITQVLMAAPLLVLYNLSILLAVIFARKPKPRPDDGGGDDGGGDDGGGDDGEPAATRT